MSYVIAVLDLVVSLAAGSTIFLLVDVAALVGTVGLRRAWQALGGMLACCIVLLFIHGTMSVGHPASAEDLIAATIFLIGVSFIFCTAWLSRSTARHLLRIERVARVAHVDALTGVGNRRHFDECLEAAIREAGEAGGRLSVIAFDIDHFKAVNDGYGHACGDEVLRQVAKLCVERTRLAGTLHRVGGEEFAVVVPRADPMFVQALAERLRASVSAIRIDVGEGKSISVTVSLGLATFAEGETGAELLHRADAALYIAKREGRDRLRIAV